MKRLALCIGLLFSILLLADGVNATVPPPGNAGVVAVTLAMSGPMSGAANSPQMASGCNLAMTCAAQCGTCGFVTGAGVARRDHRDRVEADIGTALVGGNFGFRIYRPPKREARPTA